MKVNLIIHLQMLSCSSESDKERWVEALSPLKSENPDETLYECWDCPQVTVIHNYVASQPDELPVVRGDVINVLRKMADGKPRIQFFVNLLICLGYRLVPRRTNKGRPNWMVPRQLYRRNRKSTRESSQFKTTIQTTGVFGELFKIKLDYIPISHIIKCFFYIFIKSILIKYRVFLYIYLCFFKKIDNKGSDKCCIFY